MSNVCWQPVQLGQGRWDKPSRELTAGFLIKTEGAESVTKFVKLCRQHDLPCCPQAPFNLCWGVLMSMISRLGVRMVVAAVAFGLALPAQAVGFFVDGFELAFGTPATDAEAARFLNQATFGATAASIPQVRASGIPAWIDQQIAAPSTLSRPFLETLAVSENTAGNSLSQSHRVHRWVDVAVTGNDQLRQRVAWALGQMVVASDQDAGLSDEVVMMAEWNDLLVRNAFGNYRTLIAETVLSPMMGRYLTHLRNRKFEIEPRCYDQRPPLNDDTDVNLAGLEYHTCTGSDATNNATLTPRIARYRLPSSGLVAPDENFARELMQLFSIGLVQRESNFDPIIDPNTGLGTPTYNQFTVTVLSRVLTGLSYACSGNRTVAGRAINRTCGCTGTDCSFNTGNFFSTPPSLAINEQGGLVHPDRYESMICYPRYHDTGRDRAGFQLPGSVPTSPPGATIDLAVGESIPGGTPGPVKLIELGGAAPLSLNEVSPGLAVGTAINCDALNGASPTASKTTCLSYCNSGVDAAINLLFNHPNTAVMVARQLIQRMISSNPSPAYIQRVAAAFANNGLGVRGDMQAVVKAVLFDLEARRPLGDPANAVDAGKTREPLLKMIQVWRSFGATPATVPYRRWARFAGGCSSFSWPQCAYQQRPLGAPSVFNFYEPDFQTPGPISDLNLVSPELQIINESTAILGANDIYNQVCAGRGTGSNHNCHGPLRTPLPTDHAWFPDAVLDGLPGGNCGTTCTTTNDADLIEVINVRLFGGAMSGTLGDLNNPGNTTLNTGTRGVLYRLLRTVLTGTFGEAVAQNTRRREVLYLLHLAAISPEASNQR